ncbi:MAG: glycosyltransferase [Acidimicrobiia bacterium]
MTEAAGPPAQPAPPEPILVAYVTARYPPMASTGTFRVEAVVRHLPAFGFRPTVITIPQGWVSQQSGSPALGRTLPAHEAHVLRPEAPGDWVLRWASKTPVLRRLARAWASPDILVRWARHVPRAVAADLAGHRLVLATSPPFSAMVAADGLAERLGVPCVQELRDPPSFDRRALVRSPAYVRRMQDLERTYLGRAAAVIALTPGMRARLLQLHPELEPARMHVVTNGYPEELRADRSASGHQPDRFTVAYVGSFRRDTRAPGWLTPAVVLPALCGLPDETELRIVGQVTEDQRRAMQPGSAGCRVTHLGRVPRLQAVSEMAVADVCLVLAAEEPWWIGRKVFEYLAFARRILAVVPEGDTAELLRSSSKSVVVPLGDEPGLHRAVHRLYRQWRDGEQPSGPEPEVPTDRSSVEGIARVLRLALREAGPDRGGRS